MAARRSGDENAAISLVEGFWWRPGELKCHFMLQFPNINLVLHLNTIKDVEIFYSLILFVLNIQLKT